MVKLSFIKENLNIYIAVSSIIYNLSLYFIELGCKKQNYCLFFFGFECTITAAIRHQTCAFSSCFNKKVLLKINIINERWQNRSIE